MENNNKQSGFLLIDKSVGPTSFDIIYKLRKITDIKKIGHAGTLDPRASGLLIVAVGREATREIDKFLKLDKEYVAQIDLSKNTDTYDMEGKVTEEFVDKKIKKGEIKKVIKSFLGKQKQIPPMFSAKKVGGKKLYELARAGMKIERKSSDIEIFDIKITKYKWPKLEIKVKCGSGTYIRSLSRDIGKKLDQGGTLSSLKRTKINKYSLRKAKKIDKLNKNNWFKFLF